MSLLTLFNRIFTPSFTRKYSVATEDRTFVVEEENRTFAVQFEDRSFVIL